MHQVVRYCISIALLIVFLFHIRGVVSIGLLEQIENSSYDARVRLTMPNTVDEDVVIIDIDEKSLTAEGQWPWPRAKVARMVRNLTEQYGVRVLGFDILFSEPERNSVDEVIAALGGDGSPASARLRSELSGTELASTGEQALADAIRGQPVVLGMVFQGGDGGQLGTRIGQLPKPLIDAETAKQVNANFIEALGYTANVPILEEAAPTAGFFDNPTVSSEIDGVYRRVPLMQTFQGGIYPSLAFEIVRLGLPNPSFQFLYDGSVDDGDYSAVELEAVALGDKRIPVDEDVSVLVPYRGVQGSFPYVSATDVINGTADASVLNDTYALIGTSAPGLLDLRSTPVGGAYTGVEVHANIVSGILQDRIKHHPAYVRGLEAVMLLVIGLLIAWTFPKVRPAIAALIVLVMVAAIVGFAFLMWSINFVVPMGLPIAFAISVFLLQLLYGYFIESRGKREVTRMFGQYVPPELVDELADKPDMLNMKGESREMSVLFSDVRGFTTISEGLDSAELTALMNEFLTPLTRVIHEHRGTIDKYMGDAIMAFWGAPLEDPKHAEHALEAGLEMNKAVRQLDEAFEKRGWPKLHIGVGVNTGVMSVGNMGSEFRMAYTVMGDAVNLGSRLEGLTKQYGVEFICGESTRAAAPDFVYRDLDRVRVKGRNEPVAIYEPICRKDELDSGTKQDLSRHRQALRYFRAQDWDKAEAEFFGLKQSGRPHAVYDMYLERIALYRQDPPGEHWDGVFTHTSK